MKLCFVGLGSIASRHIKNISMILPKQEWSLDVLRSGNGRALTEEQKSQIRHVYESADDIQENYDAVFITNPTRLHYQTLKKLHSHGKNFFIEKPVFETGYENLVELELRADSVYYVACPLRYTKVIQYLRRQIDFDDIYSVRCISSSYLPDWRPGADYRQSYSAKKELGGGVSIDLIHEWDYISYLLGEPQTIKSIICKKSNLEIDSDDVAVYLAEYPDKVVELHLDYFGRVPMRKIELFGKDDVIEANLIDEKITYRKSNQVVSLSEERDEYQKKELKHFFKMIVGEAENENSIENACRVLRMARGEY